MTKDEWQNKMTIKVANLRVQVESAINRVKSFRILKNVLPITMLHHAVHIVKTCAALCNFKPSLIRTSARNN